MEAKLDDIEIEFDEAKRTQTLIERGLDFLDAPKVFNGSHLQLVDDREDYGEVRFNVFGTLDDRRVALTWTPRGTRRRIISMRHYHDEELEDLRRTLG